MLRPDGSRADPADPPTRAARTRSSAAFAPRSSTLPLLVVPTADDVADLRARASAPPRRRRCGGSIVTFAGLAREVARTLAAELGAAAVGDPAAPGAGPGGDPPRAPRPAAPLGGTARIHARRSMRLIAELQAALIAPARVRRGWSTRFTMPGYETRARARSTPPTSSCATRAGAPTGAIVAAAASPRCAPIRRAGASGRCSSTASTTSPRDQIELVRELARTADGDGRGHLRRQARARGRAGLLGAAHRGARRRAAARRFPSIPTTPRAPPCAISTAACSSPGRRAIDADDGLVLLDSAGAAGRGGGDRDRDRPPARRGHEPDEIAIVLRHPDSSGPVLADVLGDSRDPGRARGLDRRWRRPASAPR